MATLELKLDRSTFLNAISKTQGVVDRKSTSNMLSHLLIETTGDKTVRLVGTDYDVTILAETEAEIIEAGAACINGKALFDVVKQIDESPIHIKAEPNDWAKLTAGRASFNLAGVSPQDYPGFKMPEDIQWVKIPASALRDLFGKTKFSMSTDETRMNLNGVFFKIKASGDDGLTQLTMVSTDGHRLSKVELEVELESPITQPLQAIVHKKGVAEIDRLFDGDSSIISVGFSKSDIIFEGGGTTFKVRQIEDNYPDYSRVIPAQSPIKVVVPRDRLTRAIRKTSSVSSNNTHIIKVELQEGTLAVTSPGSDRGSGRDELDIDYQGGPAMVIGFNYRYLLDVLGVISGEQVVFELNDEFSPTVLTSPAEPGAIFVVMPMRV